MACAGATCGDVELMEVPLSLPREEGKDAGDAPPSGADVERGRASRSFFAPIRDAL